ncbi:MAG: hypothetical protein SVW77_04115 [Candidatus Nanohaloarchaea archaeon]|nr:hypothetical protein [Candidatus Nanohaloarchaea archaeon]
MDETEIRKNVLDMRFQRALSFAVNFIVLSVSAPLVVLGIGATMGRTDMAAPIGYTVGMSFFAAGITSLAYSNRAFDRINALAEA